jgi:Tfp pilus assembly protein PilF
MVRLLRNISFSTCALALASTLILMLLAVAPAAASQDPDRDLKGFDEQIKRREMASRALSKGRTYLEDKSYKLARESLIEALRLYEDLHEARFYLGLTEYRDGKFKLAVAQFKSLYKRKPSYPTLSLELARGYLALRQCSVASRWLKIHLGREEKSKESDKLKREIAKCAKNQEKQH